MLCLRKSIDSFEWIFSLFFCRDFYIFVPFQVQLGSPAHGELMRGDILTKVGDYDARDLTHLDAQNLFKTAANRIQLVVHRYRISGGSESTHLFNK